MIELHEMQVLLAGHSLLGADLAHDADIKLQNVLAITLCYDPARLRQLPYTT